MSNVISCRNKILDKLRGLDTNLYFKSIIFDSAFTKKFSNNDEPQIVIRTITGDA